MPAPVRPSKTCPFRVNPACAQARLSDEQASAGRLQGESYCDAHIDIVATLERLRTVLERASAATDELLATVNRLNERIARLEVRFSLYAALLGACAGVAGWIVGALIVQWLSRS